MLIEELIRTCSVSTVAEAAVASVGADFVEDIRRAATDDGMSVGEYAAKRVASFGRTGGEGDMRAIARAMTNTPAPMLAGLRHILTASRH